MHFEAWQLWTILATILVAAEVFAPGFVLACFAVGCLLSALLAFWKLGVTYQLLGFTGASLAAFWGIRPLLVKQLAQKHSLVKTNAEALVGKRGTVTDRVDPATGQGRVVVEGENWWGCTEAGRPLELQEVVIVTRIDGAKLVVEPEAIRGED